MKRLLYIPFIFLLALGLSSCEVANQVLGSVYTDTGSKPLSNSEVIQGLKDALKVGTDTSVTQLASVNGYLKDEAVKILLPPEFNKAISELRQTGAGEKLYVEVVAPLVDKMTLSLNRAAEHAAIKAKPIFLNAIRGMTIQDGFQILRGGPHAATDYLHNKTYTQLVSAFKPDVRNVLSQPLVFNRSSQQLYSDFVNAYNNIEERDKFNLLKIDKIQQSDLSAYVTGKALDGLFQKVAAEEADIRKDPAARVTAILKRVFG